MTYILARYGVLLAMPAQILAAAGLDLLFGKPRSWPRIARITGHLAREYERTVFSIFPRGIVTGGLYWMTIAGTMLGSYAIIDWICSSIHPALSWVFETFIIYQTIAARNLDDRVRAVLNPLQAGDPGEARSKLSSIGGCDTAHLDESEISRVTVESVAGSIADAIVSPLFWAAVFGAPGALLYRTADTLDSLVGHRTPRYEFFGRASARAAYAMCWLPDRLSALGIASVDWFRCWGRVREEAGQPASRNGGWPEAAMAFVLNIRLGGTNFYEGKPLAMPLFHPFGRLPRTEDIRSSLGVMWRVFALATACALIVSFFGAVLA